MEKREWTEEQNLAINRKVGNILVSASAGSGKTAVLVERIIKKIIKEKIDIDSLVIVTFTNAAASEMRERILDAIYSSLDKDPDNKHLVRQVINISKAKITTIDAFCMDIVKNNFYLTDLDPNFSICNEVDGYTMRNKAINMVLEEEYGIEKNEILQDVVDLFDKIGDDKFIETILKMYRYIQSFPYPFDYLNEMIEKYNINMENLENEEYIVKILQIIEEEIKALINILKKTIESLEYDEELDKYLDSLREDKQKYEICLKNISSFDRVQELLNSSDFFVRLSGKRNIQNVEGKEEIQNLRKYIKEKHKTLCKYMYANLKKVRSDIKETYKYLKYFAHVITLFDERYMELKKAKNLLDFSDISHIALNILVKKEIKEDGSYSYKDTDVAKKYKEKYNEIYIDEYQDSNLLQEALLLAISRKEENKPNQFMVGDIKQSIYKFRQAMPQLFLDKYETYSKEIESNYLKIVLSKNFRSRKNVLDSINYIFTKIMSKEVGECSYKDEECLLLGANFEKNDNNNYDTEINIININKEKEIDDDIVDEEETNDSDEDEIVQLNKLEIESKEIAKKVKELVNGTDEKEPFKVYDLKNKKFRDIKYRDIVILTRSLKNKAKVIEESLKEQEIPVFSDYSEAFFSSNEVKLITSFLEVLDNRYQDLPLVAIMYSIIGKFTLDELVKLRSYNKKDYIYNSILEAKKYETGILKEKIDNFLILIEKFIEYSKEYSIKELLLKIYNETDVYIQFKSMENGKQMCANLDSLLDIASNFESSGSKGLYQYILYINEAKDRQDKSMSAKIIGENEDVVRIMSIHKSKGLEFPVVILAGSANKFNLEDLKNEILMHHELGIAMSVISKQDDYMITYPSVIKHVIKSVIKKETISEELRLLYVALTRAKEKIIIYSTVTNYEKYFNNKYIMKEDNGIINPMSVLEIHSYFDAIMFVLKDYEKAKDSNFASFNINIIEKSQYNKIEQNDENVKNILEEWNEFSDKIEDKDITDSTKQKIVAKLQFKYPYIKTFGVKNKYSVSEIKKMFNEDNKQDISNDFKNYDSNNKKLIKIPKFLNEETNNNTSAYKGTLIHLILENIDYRKNIDELELNVIIDKLIKDGKILENDKQLIEVEKILLFVNSDIGKRLKSAKKINKEAKFVIKKKIKDVKELNIDLDDYILLQGIIDLYFIDENDKIVLIDFKTDNIKEKEQFITKYKVQLEIYKEAIEKCLNKKVDEIYIYSFNLKDKIAML